MDPATQECHQNELSWYIRPLFLLPLAWSPTGAARPPEEPALVAVRRAFAAGLPADPLRRSGGGGAGSVGGRARGPTKGRER